MEFKEFIALADELSFPIERKKNLYKIYLRLKESDPGIIERMSNDRDYAILMMSVIKMFFETPLFAKIYLLEKVHPQRRLKFLKELHMDKIEKYIYNRFYNHYFNKSEDKNERLSLDQLKYEVNFYYGVPVSVFEERYLEKAKKIRRNILSLKSKRKYN